MEREQIKKLSMTALFTALCCISTLLINIPTPTGGYVNAGDAVVLLSAFLLGPIWGALAAGLGSAMADVLVGYAIYAPATLIIKALMALAAGFIFKKLSGKSNLGAAVTSSIVAEVIMISGYFVFTATVLGFGMGAVAEIPGNCIQGVFAVVAGTALFTALSKIGYVRKMFL